MLKRFDIYFQSLLDSGFRGVCLQRHIISHIFIQRLQTFCINVTLLCFLTFLFNFELFLHLWLTPNSFRLGGLTNEQWSV